MKVWESENPKAVIVIVHGANEHHRRYYWLIEKLVADGFHVVTGDLPGQGENPEYSGHVDSFEQYIDTIESWYERAKHYQLPTFLLGHSMGGLAVIQTMIKRKLVIDGIVLSSPCLGLVEPPSKMTHLSGKLLNKIAPKFRMPTNLAPATRCEETIKKDQEDPLIIKKVSVRWYLELAKAIKKSHENVSEFPDVPLVILQGGDDLIVDKKAVSNWFHRLPITDKYYKEWPKLYHEVFNEPQKEKVYRIAISFVEGHL